MILHLADHFEKAKFSTDPNGAEWPSWLVGKIGFIRQIQLGKGGSYQNTENQALMK